MSPSRVGRPIAWTACLALFASIAGCTFGWLTPGPVTPSPDGTRIGLEERDGVASLVVRRRAGEVETVVAARSVRLVLGDGQVRELPFVSHLVEGDRLTVRCGPAPDHSVELQVAAREHRVGITISDAVELPSQVAELSIDYELIASDATPPTDRESFAPTHGDEPGAIVGDQGWRLPAAFVRSGKHAFALLPDTTTARPRTLPGALEVSREPTLRVRHGMVALRQDANHGGLRGVRDPELRAAVAGQTLTVEHELLLFTDAEPHRTLRGIASDVWSHGLARCGDTLLQPNTPRAQRILARRPPLPLRPDQTSTWSFSARANPNLLAAAFASSPSPDDRAQCRSLLELANSAPQRGGLSPTVLQVEAGKPRRWRQADEHSATYDATANAWTRTTGLWAAKSLDDDDPVRVETVRLAGALAAFLLDNQRPNGAIPAHFDTTYLAPIRDHLYDPAPEAGAAALLLAEVGGGDSELARRARAGAIAALLYLQREIVPDAAWFDSETPFGDGRPRVRGMLAVTLAALASLRVLDYGEHADVRATARILLDDLIRHQQAWSPTWLGTDPTVPDLFGGFGAHEADPRWSEPGQALAALALLRGYDHFGERELLQRGAHAAQAALAAAMADDSEHAALGSAGVAAAVGMLVLAGWGHAVVDLQGGFCESIDGPRATYAPQPSNELRLTLQTHHPDVVAERVVFRGLTSTAPVPLFVNGQRVGEHSAAALRDGIELQPEQIPLAAMAPPSTVQLDQAFWPRLLFGAPPPAGWSAEIEITAGDQSRGSWRRALQATDDATVWTTREPLVPSAIGSLGKQLTATVTLRGESGATTTLTTHTLIARETTLAIAGRDDVDCLSRATSRRVVFADGMRVARLAGRDQPLRWRLSIDPGTSGLELEVLLAGRLSLYAGDSLLHEDPPEVGTGPRTLRVTLGDRRLWETGTLTLSFVAADGAGARLQVAELEVLAAAATAAHDRELGPSTRSRAADPRLRLAVVPVALADAPLRYGRDQFHAMMFGDDYATTPEPNQRATSGSVRQVISAASGGRTLLVGDVAAPTNSPLLAADLRANPERLRDLAALRPHAVVLVHGGTRIPEPAEPLRIGSGGASLPVLLIAEQCDDRSALASSDVAAALLRGRYGLPRVDAPADGNFGELALAGAADQHFAPSPLGVDLARLGWADLVDVGTDSARELAGGPLAIDRRVFRLTSGVSGRGDLYLEARGGVAPDAGLPEAGMLAYWDLPVPPLVVGPGGQLVRPTRLRLARDLGATLAPFRPGSHTELIQRSLLLDDSSVPSLATPQGELFFRLRDVAVAHNADDSTPPQLGMVVEPLVRDLLEETPTPAVGVGVGWTPLPSDGVDRGVGAVDLRPGSVRVSARQHGLRLTWAGRAIDGRANRLFGRARLTGGPVRVRAGQDAEVALDAVWKDNDRDFACVVDLFAPHGADALSWLEFTATSPTPAHVEFEQLLMVPRARPDHTPLRFDRLHSAQLSDGKLHAPLARLIADSRGTGEIVEPTLLPARRTMLRLRGGFAADAPADTQARLQVKLRSFDGKEPELTLLDDFVLRRGAGEQPILTALLHIPKVEQPRTAMLAIRIVAPPGTTLWLAAVEVTRP